MKKQMPEGWKKVKLWENIRVQLKKVGWNIEL
jgi:hypothetical protein